MQRGQSTQQFSCVSSSGLSAWCALFGVSSGCLNWLSHLKIYSIVELSTDHKACRLAWSEKTLVVPNTWIIYFGVKGGTSTKKTAQSTTVETCVYLSGI